MTKSHVQLVVKNASELITLRGKSLRPARKEELRELEIIEDGAVAINEGRIVAVDKSSKIEQRFKAEDVLSAHGKTVMPGFVDPHTHLVFAGSREEEFELRIKGSTYMEILAEGGGILKTVRETREASKDQLLELGKGRLNQMLKHGTTTVEAKSGYGLNVDTEIKCLKAANELDQDHPVDVVSTFLGAHAIPPAYTDQENEYVNLVVDRMIPEVADQELAEFCDVFCEQGVFTVEQSRRILLEGKKQGLAPKVHADEMTRFGGAELAAEVGAVSAEHLLHSSETGLKAMATRNVVAVLLPTASFTLMGGNFADARRMIQLDLPIALGTDFNPSCWVENMQLAIAFACRQMHLTTSEAVTASTINAAHAVARAKEVGSLEPGKKGDLVILSVPNHKFLGYRFGVNLVETTIKEGRIVSGCTNGLCEGLSEKP